MSSPVGPIHPSVLPERGLSAPLQALVQLRGLTDRVEALGGRLSLDSSPQAGTRLLAEIPLG